ncbi:MAG: hypothetical protein U0840_19845 [Gemmataceae bacterium]
MTRLSCNLITSLGSLPRLLTILALTLGATSLLPARAEAGGYTVYIYNMNSRYGWIRSGWSHDVYTSYQACRSSITSRVNDNKRWRNDWEAFAIVYQSSRPPTGLLRNYSWGIIVYIPGQGYQASLDRSSDKMGRTEAVCQASPTGSSSRMPFRRRGETSADDESFAVA